MTSSTEVRAWTRWKVAQGDDRYGVDHAGDQVFERPGQGSDTVTSTVAMALPEHVEHLVLLGVAALDASGNDAPQPAGRQCRSQ